MQSAGVPRENMELHGETQNKVYQEISKGRPVEPVGINAISGKAKITKDNYWTLKEWSEMNRKNLTSF